MRSYLACLLIPFTSQADTQGVIDKIKEAYVFSKDHGTASFDYTNMVQIHLASAPITLTGCSSTYLVFSLDPAVEPNGEAMYSTILTAMASDRSVRFGLTNSVAYAGHCAIMWMTLQ